MKEDLRISSREQIIIEKFSNLVGVILTYAESAIPVESQCKAFKKLLEKAVYNTRNEVLACLTSNVDK